MLPRPHSHPPAAEIAPAEIERQAGALALRLAELAAQQPDPTRLASDLAHLLHDELGAAQVVLFARRATRSGASARSAPDHLRVTAAHPTGENSDQSALRAAALRALHEQRLIESRATTDGEASMPHDPYIAALPLGALTPTCVLALRWETAGRQADMWPLPILIRLAPALALATTPLRARHTPRAAAKTATPAVSSASAHPAKTATPPSSSLEEELSKGHAPAKTAIPIALSLHRSGERGESPAKTATAPTPPAELLALMSHELRTPLNTINGFLEILLDGLAGPLSERQHEFLSYAHTSTRRLTQLLEDMVLLSRPAQSDSLLYRTRTDLRGLIESARAAHAETAQSRGVALSYDLAVGLPPLWADAGRLTQALANLLGWALARAPHGSAVTLRAGPHAGGIAIVVEDSGPSLESEALARLFEPSRPTPGTTTPTTTGLELAVARRIITLHGGELRARNRSAGGIHLCCVLPGAEDAAPVATPQHEAPT